MPATRIGLHAPPRITVKGGRVIIDIDCRDQSVANQLADALAARPMQIEGRKPFSNPWPEVTIMFAAYELLHWGGTERNET